ncbi:3,4-dihydroxy 2-butanone 4-phosphate synthase [Collariella sp. IMI 366227]|nr:3,4-dihydroxy 2-butanone 4-phosphate synthase [Collariella sp. IMI 366227]
MPSTTAPDLLPSSDFDSIPDTVEAFRNGEFVVVPDSPSRENEGDLIISAAAITASQMAFMVRHTSGLICAPIPQRASALALPQMVAHTQDPRGTAYTISVDSADASVTTGISAQDRALACRALADPKVGAEGLGGRDMFSHWWREKGVRERAGHTEAAVDLCRLAGVEEAAVISELVDDGVEVEGKAVREEPGMLRAEGA